MAVQWHEFATPRLLGATLAEAVANRLDTAIEKRGRAVLAVSGGSTPAVFFRALARRQIDWSAVTVMLVDERFVPSSNERSNERMVTLNLLQANAAAAKFVGLYRRGDVAEAVGVAGQAYSRLPFPPDIAVLGMGVDGHTASIFPDAGNLDCLLDPEGPKPFLAVRSDTAGETRLTLTLAGLKQFRRIFVHIEGLEKKELLADILASRKNAPIRTVLERCAQPAEIFWAAGVAS